MKWKIFAVVYAVLFVGSLTQQARDAFDLIGRPIELVASAGLLAYAFCIPTSVTRWWTAFGWILAGWSIVVIGVGVARNVAQATPPYTIALVVIFAAAWLYPTWLAIRRLAGRGYA